MKGRLSVNIHRIHQLWEVANNLPFSIFGVVDLVQAKKSFCLSMTSCNEQWSLTICISNGDEFWMLRSNGLAYSHPSNFCCLMERKTGAPWMVIRDGYMQSCVFRFSELSFLSPGICGVKRYHFFPLLSHGNFEEMIQ